MNLIHYQRSAPIFSQKWRSSRGKLIKYLAVMKLTLLLIIATLQVSASALAQQVSLNVKKASLQEVLISIRKQSGYTFVANATDLEKSKPVTLTLKSSNIDEILQALFTDQPFIYQLQNKIIMIELKEPEKKSPISSPDEPQQKNISGVVMNVDGIPIVGATVLLKGTNQGTATDDHGRFVLSNVPTNGTLIIRVIGHETKEIQYRNGIVPKINLREIDADLKEIQVIAYGAVQKKFITSNINSIKAAAISTQPVTNPLLALAGRVPGLFIKQPSGVSGDGVQVIVQGPNSILNGNDPFFVVDGVPFPSQTLPGINGSIASIASSALNYINPADIESIEILKDADATAIYGSRAANGAILITTKKGKAGSTKVDLNAQTGWGKITRDINLLNTAQYIVLRKEALTNAGRTIGASDYDLNGAWDVNKDTDWQKELVGGTANFTNIQGSISGGSENTQFLAGGGFNRQTTVYPTDLGDTKGNAHFNINHRSNNQKLKFSLNGSYLQDINQLGSSDLMQFAVTIAPNSPSLYNADGTINWGPVTGTPGAYSFNNPLSFLLRKYNSKTSNLIGATLISYEIIPGLELKTSLGYNIITSDAKVLVPVTSIRPDQVNPNSRSASYLNDYTSSWIAEPQLTYTKKIGSGNLDALLGTTLQTTENYSRSYNASGFTSDGQLENILAAPTSSIRSALQSTYRYNAIFGRVNYRYINKYIINLNLRRDGSSRFGSENLFHNFYSIGGAWLFGDENFFKNAVSFVSQGKLRVTYGTSGNDQIGDYGFLNLYNTYQVDVPYQQTSSLTPGGHANPYLQWEETRKLNLGLDLGLFNDKVMFNVNYFRNRSSNQLLLYPLLVQTGFSIVRRNLPATVQNNGWEFMLDASPLKPGELKWNASLNLTIPRNKLIKYDDIVTSSYSNQYVIGKPTNIIKAYQFIGVNPETGIYEFRKADGTVSSTPVDPLDKTALIDLNPKYYGGFYNDFSYKGFELSFLFQFVKQLGINYRFGATVPGLVNTNQPESYTTHWQNKGDQVDLQKVTLRSAEFLAPYRAAKTSTAAYSDASYIRLKNASLSYNLPSTWMRKAHISNAKIYIQGQNLLTITKFDGTDPESQQAIFLPPLSMYTLGFQLTL